MDQYFPQNNWDNFVYQRLNELIDKYQNDPNAYAVFDFDNTSCFMDVEDNLMIYLVEHLCYKLTPSEFYQLLTDSFFEEELSLSFDPKRPEVTGYNLAKDIYDQYQYLYDHYISHSHSTSSLLTEIKQTSEYLTFRAKLRYFHTYVNTHFVREPNQGWLTYLFAGYTVEEFRKLAKASLHEATRRPFERVEFVSSSKLPGRTGVIRSVYQSGLRFPKELIDLFHALDRANIATYIVSASPKGLVCVAVEEFNYLVPRERVIAMEFQTTKDNRICAVMDPTAPITRGEGKTQAIKEQIMPQHAGKEPVAMFGDSVGDYHMMKTFQQSHLNVLFNRHMTDEFKQLVDKAVEQHEQPFAQFVLQGRDETKGALRSSPKTIPYGETVSELYRIK
ncbi:hypothetical protein CJ206_03525 [Dolosicoccus paucivorans]|uniref:HAD family hydrolase n=1 Tax=Dolosicoccus paucivorans TaxID=84521 RepID=UPI000C7FC7BF|nr:HAD family hydrolase [Dolosicoccus paucivorans]PMB84569.1 hypothetical protein CJ206_03525 [Dolosicoccus paucivorans]